MHSLLRHLGLFAAFGTFSLLGEMAFRGNYLLKVVVELIWLGLLILFYRTIFARTAVVADWKESEYLFFLGCYYALEGLLETFFLSNCGEFSDMVRSGDLDFVLLQPIDEQFLVTCRTVDWTTVPNIVAGAAVMVNALIALDWQFDALRTA